MFTLIVFLLILGLLVLSHELGHFFMARWNGIKVDEFGFGYPPRILGVQVFKKNKLQKIAEQEEITLETEEDEEGKVVGEVITDKVKEIDKVTKQRNWRFVWGGKAVEELREENKGREGTVYSINLLPLGGFCKIKGEDGTTAGDADSFMSKKIWQRMLVLASGVLMNILLAVVLLSIGFMIGLPQNISELSDVSHIKDRKIEVLSVLPGKPADAAGVKAGDVIAKLDNVDNPRLQEMLTYLNDHQDKNVQVTIIRDDKTLVKNIKPSVYSSNGKAGLGVAVAEVGVVSYSWHKSIYYGFIATGLYLKEIIVAFYLFLKALITGTGGVAGEVTGPVGIAVMTGRVARMGLSYLIQFTAVLSLNLAIVNILPIPALDGGRILFLLIEKVRRKPVSQKIEQTAHAIGFALLMLLVVVVTVRDLGAFKGLFSGLINKMF